MSSIAMLYIVYHKARGINTVMKRIVITETRFVIRIFLFKLSSFKVFTPMLRIFFI